VEVVVELSGAHLTAEIRPVRVQLLVREGIGPADELPSHAAAMAAGAVAVLHCLALHVVPVGQEGREDAPVPRAVAVEVTEAFPNAHRGEMRRFERCDVPLVHRIIRDAGEPDLAITPRLGACPLYALIQIERFTLGPHVEMAGRAASATAVDTHDRVAVRHPLFGVDQFPALIEAARIL
jgi:hypothetical protein